MTTQENLSFFYDRLKEMHNLQCIGALLGWDQRVYMPPNAAQGRADQLEYISAQMHRRFTDPEFARVVDDLSDARDSLDADDQVNVREVKRVLDRQRKLPEEFVCEMAQAESMGYNTWVKARPQDDWKAVEPILGKLIDLNKRQADLIGYEEHPYDALLDIYEPGMKLAQVKPLLLGLAESLRELIPVIVGRLGDAGLPSGHYDVDKQERLCRRVAGDVGYDFESGRLDKTAHPFMTTIGSRDFRITTRFFEDNFLPALYGSLHETGHALYELGLPAEKAGTPLGDTVSLGIHESQSRFWENLVGRSREFSGYLSGVIEEFFPDESDADRLWSLANRVSPSLIRVEADEVTYNQHIVIRMLLEEALVTDRLSVADLPAAWNDLYEKYLGVRPSDFRYGVMQDVHWFSGSIGYFPTYALGNLYGAMMMQKAREDLPSMSAQIRAGEFAPLLGWLRENVHKHGMKYRAHELIERITGRELSDTPFVEYLRGKFA